MDISLDEYEIEVYDSVVQVVTEYDLWMGSYLVQFFQMLVLGFGRLCVRRTVIRSVPYDDRKRIDLLQELKQKTFKASAKTHSLLDALLHLANTHWGRSAVR